jgi:hypothetical protein
MILILYMTQLSNWISIGHMRMDSDFQILPSITIRSHDPTYDFCFINPMAPHIQQHIASRRDGKGQRVLG